MAYKIERSDADYGLLMKKTLFNWNYQEHDLYLLCSEGNKIISNKALLSFYSISLKEILNDPLVAFSSRLPSVSLPATSSCVSMLLKILCEGNALASDEGLIEEVTELANVLGIKLQNIVVKPNVEAKSHKKVKVEYPQQFTIKKEPLVDQIKEENEEKYSEKNKNKWECSGCKKVYRTRRLVIRHQKRYCILKTPNKLEVDTEPEACKECGKVMERRLLKFQL